MSTADDEREQQRAAKRQTAIEAGEMQPTADDVARVESAVARHAGATDPTAGQKLDRLLARNALTSLGRLHPANVDRATRRANKIRGPLTDAHRELKERAVQRRRDDEA